MDLTVARSAIGASICFRNDGTVTRILIMRQTIGDFPVIFALGALRVLVAVERFDLEQISKRYLISSRKF